MLMFYMPLPLPFVGRVVLDCMIAGVVALDKIVVFEVYCLRGAGGANGERPSAFGANEIHGPGEFGMFTGWVSGSSGLVVKRVLVLAFGTELKHVRSITMRHGVDENSWEHS